MSIGLEDIHRQIDHKKEKEVSIESELHAHTFTKKDDECLTLGKGNVKNGRRRTRRRRTNRRIASLHDEKKVKSVIKSDNNDVLQLLTDD